MLNEKTEIRVVIVDDHPVVRLGLRTMLESEGMSVIGMAGTAAEAISVVGQLRPDVVLMDLRMPEMDGTEAITALRRSDSAVRVLVVTNYESDEFISSSGNSSTVTLTSFGEFSGSMKMALPIVSVKWILFAI